MYLSPIITYDALWMLATALACVLLLWAVCLFRVSSVVSYRRRSDNGRREVPEEELLPVSVVIYSQGDAENLEALLRSVLSQDYPGKFEVIVVNDGESADVRDVVSLLRASHSNLYLTFTPEGVVNLSRKKLALTLGIKAARYDIVALTTSAVEIESPLWLRRLMGNFDRAGKVEIVLGYAYVDPGEDDVRGYRRRAFDNVATGVCWLASAIAGKPFRGTEYNLAYRKDVFLRNKGFARSLNLHNGDDDIFISEVAGPHNTAVELSEESMVRLRHGNHPRLFTERMLRREFTERFIRRRPRILMPLSGWLQIVAVMAVIVSSIYSYPNMQAAVLGLLILLGMALGDILTWRAVMKALRSRTMLLTLPWLSATYPLRKIWRSIRSRISKQKKYTWD